MSRSKPIASWNIISKANSGLYYLELVEFESGCSGPIVFEQIRQLCLPQRKTFSDRASSLLHSPVVYTTTVIKVIKLCFLFAHDLTLLEGLNSTERKNIEIQSRIHEVFVKTKRYNEAYTLAIRNPSRFETGKTPNFLMDRTQFEGSRKCEKVIHGLLVVQEMRHAKVVVLFGVLALLSVGMGCLVGLVSGKVELGVSVAAGLFQFLTMLQWSYIWVIRS